MGDRRRINGPLSGTRPPIFDPNSLQKPGLVQRSRRPNELRKIFLQTGLIPAADGSAYLELENASITKRVIGSSKSSLKLVCSVHGPKPIPRASSFSPNLQLSASVKFSPSSTRHRHGYTAGSTEKDLGTHLENALKGFIVLDRWPKSNVDVSVTILEGEEENSFFPGSKDHHSPGTIALFTILSGCITAAAAALVDAQIDCLDLLVGGVASAVPNPDSGISYILDPTSAENQEIIASCVVGYLPSRDEVTEVWMSGATNTRAGGDQVHFDKLLDSAIIAARGAHSVLKEVIDESFRETSNGTV